MIAIVYLLAVLMFLRSTLFALGKKLKKITRLDTLENQQKLTGLVFIVVCILAELYRSTWFLFLGLINLLLTFTFYLQPTARTTKTILKIFSLVNILFIAIIIYNYIR